MAAKKIVTDKRKNYIRDNYAKIIDKGIELKPHEQQYLNKVRAGKARAASGIKDSRGQYIIKNKENELARQLLAQNDFDVSKVRANNTAKIAELLAEAGLTKKDIKTFYEQQKNDLDDITDTLQITGTAFNIDRMSEELTTFAGKVFIDTGNGIEEVTALEAKILLANFKQYVYTRANVVEIKLNPVFNLEENEMTLQIPDGKEMMEFLKKALEVDNLEQLKEAEGEDITQAIQDFLDSKYGDPKIVIYASSKQNAAAARRKKRAAEKKRMNKTGKRK